MSLAEMKPLQLPAPKKMGRNSMHPKQLGSLIGKDTSSKQRWDFEYSNQISIPAVLDDFFNHHDFGMLESARSIYEKDPPNDIQEAVLELISSVTSERVKAAMKLLHYSMGTQSFI
jgi:hypothetical protein